MRRLLWVLLALLTVSPLLHADRQAATGYAALTTLFDEWLAFERPAIVNGAPDYSAPAMAQKLNGLKAFRLALRPWRRSRGRANSRSTTPSCAPS